MITFDFEKVSQLLNEEISTLNFEKNPKELYQPVRYFLNLGGKRMRPLLAVLSCYLFDNDYFKSIKSSIAIELFHNFTLLHDDIMDKAPLRRGMPTVHEKWNENIALLAGDVTLIEAYQQLENLPESVRKDVVKMFNKTAFEVCEGQQFDMNFEIRNDVTIDEYLEMIRLKTAVLLGFSMYMGARIGGASINESLKMYDCAVAMGIAFQIKDDYLDAFAQSEKFGKQIGGDILADKKTFLMLKALSLDEKNELKTIIQTKTKSENKVAQVLEIYNNLNIKEITFKEMQKYFDKALEILKTIETESNKKIFIEQYFIQLINREN